MLTLANENSYKSVLKGRIAVLKEKFRGKYNFQKLAVSCGVQKTYLSRALNSNQTKCHLSPDQLYLALKFLDIAKKDREYVTLLYEMERSQNGERIDEVRKKIEEMRKEARKSEVSLQEAGDVKTSSVGESEYYLNPFLQLIHLFFMLDRFKQKPEAIGKKLGLTYAQLNAYIKQLERMGFLEQNQAEKTYKSLKKKTHLPADSPLYIPYRTMLRLRTMDHLQRRSRDGSYSFSVLFTTDEETKNKIHENFLSFLKSTEKLVSGATGGKKHVYQLNFDLLNWSE